MAVDEAGAGDDAGAPGRNGLAEGALARWGAALPIAAVLAGGGGGGCGCAIPGVSAGVVEMRAAAVGSFHLEWPKSHKIHTARASTATAAMTMERGFIPAAGGAIVAP